MRALDLALHGLCSWPSALSARTSPTVRSRGLTVVGWPKVFPWGLGRPKCVQVRAGRVSARFLSGLPAGLRPEILKICLSAGLRPAGKPGLPAGLRPAGKPTPRENLWPTYQLTDECGFRDHFRLLLTASGHEIVDFWRASRSHRPPGTSHGRAGAR
jgi:hypothetical protein